MRPPGGRPTRVGSDFGVVVRLPARASHARRAVVVAAGRAMGFGLCYVVLEVALGWLPVWHRLMFGSVPLRPLAFAAASIVVAWRCVRILSP